MLRDMEFKIQLTNKDIDVYGETKFFANNDSMANQLGKAAVEADIFQVNAVINLNYTVEFETRDYGIKSLILSANAISSTIHVEYQDSDESLIDIDLELDLSEFETIFISNDNVNDGLYPVSAELDFDDRKVTFYY